MVMYLPVISFCSPCGQFSGSNPVDSRLYLIREEAAKVAYTEFEREDRVSQWGDGWQVLELDLPEVVK